LHQQPLELHAIQQLAQRRDLTAGIGGVGALGNGHAQAVGVESHLGDKTRCAGGGFIDRASQGLAVAHQSVDGLCHAGLGRHPLLQQDLVNQVNVKVASGYNANATGFSYTLSVYGCR